MVMGGEGGVRFERVGADADDLGARVAKVVVRVAKRASLDRAAERFVLRIEKENDVLFAAKILEPDFAAPQGGKSKIRSASSHGKAHETFSSSARTWPRTVSNRCPSSRRTRTSSLLERPTRHASA